MNTFLDIEYAVVNGKKLYLDLYMPVNVSAPELLVWIHGGAWRQGSKDDPHFLLGLIEDGFAVASIQYRFSQEALFPAQIHDCKGAIRWLRANAERYGYNATRIGVAGASAGGHLVALLGTSANVAALEGAVGGNLKESSTVQAVVDLFGPTNFLEMLGKQSDIDHAAADSPESELVGGPIEEMIDQVKRADPITYISSNAPPFLIIHGNADQLVPYQQSEILAAALQEVGADVTLTIIPSVGHGGPAFYEKVPHAIIQSFFIDHIR